MNKRPAQYLIKLLGTDDALLTTVGPFENAALVLQLVDTTWANAEYVEKIGLQNIVITRNGRAYLGCPRPE